MFRVWGSGLGVPEKPPKEQHLEAEAIILAWHSSNSIV